MDENGRISRLGCARKFNWLTFTADIINVDPMTIITISLRSDSAFEFFKASKVPRLLRMSNSISIPPNSSSFSLGRMTDPLRFHWTYLLLGPSVPTRQLWFCSSNKASVPYWAIDSKERFEPWKTPSNDNKQHLWLSRMPWRSNFSIEKQDTAENVQRKRRYLLFLFSKALQHQKNQSFAYKAVFSVMRWLMEKYQDDHWSMWALTRSSIVPCHSSRYQMECVTRVLSG